MNPETQPEGAMAQVSNIAWNHCRHGETFDTEQGQKSQDHAECCAFSTRTSFEGSAVAVLLDVLAPPIHPVENVGQTNHITRPPSRVCAFQDLPQFFFLSSGHHVLGLSATA